MGKEAVFASMVVDGLLPPFEVEGKLAFAIQHPELLPANTARGFVSEAKDPVGSMPSALTLLDGDAQGFEVCPKLRNIG